MIPEFSAFLALFKQGKALANSATWKNRTLAANAVITVLGALVAIAKGFGYDLHLDDQTISAAGAGIAALMCIGNSVMHVITSEKVGLPAAAGAGSVQRDDPGPSSGPG